MFEYLDAPGNATNEGVFIPVADLLSVQAAELAAGEANNLKFGKIVNSIFTSLGEFANLASVLGITIDLGTVSPVSGNVFSRSFSFAWQKFTNQALGTIAVLPVPATGALTGIGGLSINDIFPNAEKVAAAGAVPSAGLVISSAAIQSFVPLAHVAIDVAADSRLWWMGLMESMIAAALTRSTTVDSPILTTTRPSITSPTVPTAYTQATDPTTGLLLANIPLYGLQQRNLSLSVEFELDPILETFDVRSAIN